MTIPGPTERDIPPAANDDLIFDAGTTDFEERIMRASIETPILVDFWAPWCGPCKQLGPALEQAVRDAGGKVRMAKVNIDENPELAQALRIQSVPMVFAFFNGQPVNAFVGVKSPSEIAAFIDQMVKMAQQARPDAIDIPATLEEAGQALADGNIELAQGLYVQVMSQDENNVAAYTGLIRTFIAAGQTEHAQEMINEAPELRPAVCGGENRAGTGAECAGPRFFRSRGKNREKPRRSRIALRSGDGPVFRRGKGAGDRRTGGNRPPRP